MDTEATIEDGIPVMDTIPQQPVTKPATTPAEAVQNFKRQSQSAPVPTTTETRAPIPQIPMATPESVR